MREEFPSAVPPDEALTERCSVARLSNERHFIRMMCIARQVDDGAFGRMVCIACMKVMAGKG